MPCVPYYYYLLYIFIFMSDSDMFINVCNLWKGVYILAIPVAQPTCVVTWGCVNTGERYLHVKVTFYNILSTVISTAYVYSNIS